MFLVFETCLPGMSRSAQGSLPTLEGTVGGPGARAISKPLFAQQELTEVHVLPQPADSRCPNTRDDIERFGPYLAFVQFLPTRFFATEVMATFREGVVEFGGFCGNKALQVLEWWAHSRIPVTKPTCKS